MAGVKLGPVLALLATAALGMTSVATAQPAGGSPEPSRSESPSASGDASAPAPAEPDPAAREAEAKRHFVNGVKLYRDENWAGALAEFEAAYTLKPSAGAMQNIALCLKSMFRYAEAADRLEDMLEKHSAELDADERHAVEDAIAELSALVGSLRIEVVPDGATVSLDQKATSAEDRASGIRVNVGEHTIVAESPGYARTTRVVRVAGGQQLTETLTLRATAGFVTVETGDPDAAIAIDGKPLAFERWTGPIAPGRRLLQVYKEGHRPFQRRVDVKVGERVTIRAKLGGPREPAGPEPPPEPDAPSLEPPSIPDPQRGWYALGAFTVFAPGDVPEDINIQPNDERAGGIAGGVRAGYRVWSPLAAEAMLDFGRNDVRDASVSNRDYAGDDQCGSLSDADVENAPECRENYSARYTVDSFRIGGNLRIMSGGERLRFTSIAGVGAVFRTLTLTPDSSDFPGGTASGVDPYFLLELGAQLNIGHLLFELDFVASIEGTRYTTGNLFGGNEDVGEVFRQSGGGLRLFGLGLRSGWGEWSPSKSAKLEPSGRR